MNKRRGLGGGGSPAEGRDCALADDFLPMTVSFYRALAFQAKVEEST
jgi:hypothetical protein